MISATDWNTIANALRVAAEQYDKDATTHGDMPGLVDQFKEQAFHARRLADIADDKACA